MRIGNARPFEAMLGVMVALMGLAFIGSAIHFFPGFEVTLRGFVTHLPGVAEGSVLAGSEVHHRCVPPGRWRGCNWILKEASHEVGVWILPTYAQPQAL